MEIDGSRIVISGVEDSVIGVNETLACSIDVDDRERLKVESSSFLRLHDLIETTFFHCNNRSSRFIFHWIKVSLCEAMERRFLQGL